MKTQTAVKIIEDIDRVYVIRCDADPDNVVFGREKPLFVQPWDANDRTNRSYLACEQWINDQPKMHFFSCACLPKSETSKALGKYTGQSFVECYCDCKNDASNPTRQDSDTAETSTQKPVWDEKAEHENDLRQESIRDFETWETEQGE